MAAPLEWMLANRYLRRRESRSWRVHWITVILAAIAGGVRVARLISSRSNVAGVLLKGIDPGSASAVTDLAKDIEKGSLDNLVHPERLLDVGGPEGDEFEQIQEAREKVAAQEKEREEQKKPAAVT